MSRRLKQAAVVFIDLSSFTPLAEAMGDATAAEVLERFSNIVRRSVGAFDGRVVKQIGDAVDWWRVEEIEDLRLLRLRAEMRVPGRAWLDLLVEDDGSGGSLFRQTAYFLPHGLLGRLYWWSVTPFHGIVFGGMQRNIARAAENLHASGSPGRRIAAHPLRRR